MIPHAEGPLSVGWMEATLHKPRKVVTFLARATCALRNGEPSVPIKPDTLSGDLHADEDPARALLYPSDFAPLKTRTDIVLSGLAYAPGGQSVTVLSVTLAVGTWRKTLAVIGDRELSGGLNRVSEPRPFITMPLSYEGAFGGAGVAANPIGRGATMEALDDGRRVRRLPNVETLESVRGDVLANRPPAGFGPIPWTWPQRSKKAGSYGGDWLEKHWPAFPPDLDPAFFNAAPDDQQVPGYLRGDEPLRLENLHPAHPVLETRLPGIRVRCFYAPIRGSYPEPREVPVKLDTLAIDTERSVVNLVWRGAVEFPADAGPIDEDPVLFAAENLSEGPFDIAYYRLLLKSLYAGTPRPPRPGDTEVVATAPVQPVNGETTPTPAVTAAQEVPVELEKPQDPDEPLDPALAALDQQSPPPVAAQQFDQVQQDPELAAEIEEAERLERQVAEAPPEPDPSPPPPPPTPREVVLAHMLKGEPLSGADLTGADLAGLDLQDFDFSAANLAGARLMGSNLTRANLDGAVLSGVDLTDGKLMGASLIGADLTDAVLNRADLSGATLEDALLTRAKLQEAVLTGAHASRAFFDAARMANADFTGAVLVESYFTEARMPGARFDGADLSRANFERAWGRGVSFVKANLSELRGAGAVLPGGKFTSTFAPRSVWQKAHLAGSEFSGGDFQGSEFEAADLRTCRFDATELRQSRFVATDARGLRATSSGLFRTNFEKADLRQAMFVGSNLFESSFQDAVAEGAAFDRCNLRRSIAPASI